MPEVTAALPVSGNPIRKKALPEPLTKDEAIRNALMLGLNMVELRSRIQIALIEPKHFSLRLVSVWRALFNKIAILHTKTFPDSATASTLYEPPSKDTLPYLYPPESDYANVGIPGDGLNGLPILPDFKIFEVTRRAINCLTILYIDKDKSLIPDTIGKYQAHLVQAILEAAIDPGAGGGQMQNEECSLNLKTEDFLKCIQSLPEAERNHQKAIAVLTERTVKFLSAWDGYLRENYYMGGSMPNDDTELTAYEAGRSISMLSWGVTMQTVPLESKDAEDKLEIKNELIAAWKFVFRDSEIIRLHHQINSLSTVLDDAYYLKHPEVERPKLDDTLIEPDPDKPCQIINAVKQSIEYWQRSVKWICTINIDGNETLKPTRDFVEISKSMRMALIQQVDIWKTLLTGQQSLRAYRMETISYKLMQDLTDEIQNNLRKDFKGSMQQAEKVMKDVASDVKGAIDVAGELAKSGLEQMYKSYKVIFWVIVSIIIVFLVVCVALSYLNRGGGLATASGSAGFLGVVSAIIGYLKLGQIKSKQTSTIEQTQTSVQKKVDAKAISSKEKFEQTGGGDGSILSRIQGVAKETGKAILEGVERAYKQIKIELAGLKFSAAVSYPLIEFFVMQGDVKSDEAFLTQIIWDGKDRNEEVKRIASAAFGSLAIFITPLSNQNEKEIDDNN